MAGRLGGGPRAPEPDEGAPAPEVTPKGNTRYKSTGRRTRPRRRTAAPLAPVVLSWLPGRVIVLGDHVIPNLAQAPIVAGVCGIQVDKHGNPNFTGIADDDYQRGGMFLEPDEFPYLARDADGRWVNDWETTEEYAALVASWVDEGRIDAPEVEDVELLVERLERLASSVRIGQHQSETITPELERQVAVARAYVAERRAA